MAVAKRSCPHAVVVPGRHRRYRELSERIFAIFDDVTPLVEPLSIDEAFLDVTGMERLSGLPPVIAADVKRRVRVETGLTASVGVGPNKFIAKLASAWEKPDGLTVVEAGELPGRLAPLPIRKMWGVGPAAERRLNRAGIRSFGDLQVLAPDEARRRLGAFGEHLRCLALGEDERGVVPDGRAKSIGQEQTFGVDVASAAHLRRVLLQQTEHVARRLRARGLSARTVTVKIRDGDFHTVTRSATLEAGTDRTDLLWRAARALFAAWCAAGFRPVRLIGVTASNLRGPDGGQLELFGAADERPRRLDRATDAICARFGPSSIGRGLGGER
jgi:DNA polymerase-4